MLLFVENQDLAPKRLSELTKVPFSSPGRGVSSEDLSGNSIDSNTSSISSPKYA